MLERDIMLIDSLCGQPDEHSCLEFIQGNDNPNLIGKLCFALSKEGTHD